jgi:hypothetical protein
MLRGLAFFSSLVLCGLWNDVASTGIVSFIIVLCGWPITSFHLCWFRTAHLAADLQQIILSIAGTRETLKGSLFLQQLHSPHSQLERLCFSFGNEGEIPIPEFVISPECTMSPLDFFAQVLSPLIRGLRPG